MPFLVGLTIDERSSLSKINVSNKAFTDDAISAGVNNASLIPSYLSVTAMQNDMTLFNQLDDLEGIANQLCERIQDTRILAGSEAYMSALALYRLFGSAAEAGVPGADTIVDHLKERFNQSTSNPAPATPAL